MSRIGNKLIASAAYRLAWITYNSLPQVSKEDRIAGWKKLKTYIDILASSETNPQKIATSALLLMQRFEHGVARKPNLEARLWA